MKKIDIFVNNYYFASTNSYKTCREAKNSVYVGTLYTTWDGKNKTVKVGDKITANFSRS